MSTHATSAVLRVLVPETAKLLGDQEFEITSTPFRVGRGKVVKGALMAALVRTFKAADHDDVGDQGPNLALPERAEGRYVSKDHFSIVQESGQFVLIDNGSSLGTIVEGKVVGGNRKGGRSALKHNDVIVVGSHRSGFMFKFLVRRPV